MAAMQLFIVILVLAVLSLRCFALDEMICEAFDRRFEHVTALVPARAGSKGIKDKNLSVLKNQTLLARTLKIIYECHKFDSVWVSTDGQKIADEAAACGAKIHWRNVKTATDNASSLSAVEDFLISHEEVQIIAVVQCTSPFIRSEFLCQALDYMLEEDVDCVFSVTRSHQLRWKQTSDGFVSPINFDPKKRPRRQEWNGEFVENGMFYIVKRNLVLQENVFQNGRHKTTKIAIDYVDNSLKQLKTTSVAITYADVNLMPYGSMWTMIKHKIKNVMLFVSNFSTFCFTTDLKQSTLMIAVIELTLTSFSLFLLLLCVFNIQDIIDLISSDLEQLEEYSLTAELSDYFKNDESKMLTGQHFASLMMVLINSSLIIITIHFISCVLLLYGAIRHSSRYLLPWIAVVLFEILTACFFLFLATFLPTYYCKTAPIVTGFLLLTAELYGWLIVVCYYRELKS